LPIKYAQRHCPDFRLRLVVEQIAHRHNAGVATRHEERNRYEAIVRAAVTHHHFAVSFEHEQAEADAGIGRKLRIGNHGARPALLRKHRR